MSVAFSTAHKFTARWEGGYVNHPNDPGKATAYGVSLRWLREEGIDLNGDGAIDEGDIAALSPAKAAGLFKSYFWDVLKLDDLPLPVAVAAYDAAVNTGRSQSVKFLQRACNSLGAAPPLADDGLLGAKTRARVRELAHQQGELARRAVLLREDFHRSLAARPPHGNADGSVTDYKPFLNGWLNRTQALLKYIAQMRDPSAGSLTASAPAFAGASGRGGGRAPWAC